MRLFDHINSSKFAGGTETAQTHGAKTLQENEKWQKSMILCYTAENISMRFPTVLSSLLAMLLLPSGITTAQGSAPAANDRYAADSFVITRNDWLYSESADGTGYREHTVAVKMQSDAAVREFSVIAIRFASASEHVELHYARVKHADGSMTETPAAGVMEQPEEVTREAPFYSDLKQAQLPVKNLSKGDTLEWQARIVRTRAEAPNEFWGQESFDQAEAVTLEESIELHVPSISAATVWTNPKLNIRPIESMDGSTKIYRWTLTQLVPTAGPEAEAAKKAKKGKLLTTEEEKDAEEGKLASVAWTSFKSWEEVGAWYRRLEGERIVPDDEIKAKVEELTAGKTSEQEKARAIYGYVSSQIRYIGVAFGVGRYQPHTATDVLHNQYGDCKDKGTLLSAMLGVLGLHADAVLIGFQVRMNEAVPSPAAFNHLITRVRVEDKQVWLDSTQEVAPYEVLLYPLRDKLALVVSNSGAATLMRTPAELPFASQDKWKAVGKIDKDGVSDSHIALTLRGDDEVVFRSAVHMVAPGQYDEMVQRIVKTFGYEGTVNHADLTRPEDTSSPFTMEFDYHREKAGNWSELQVVPQLTPIALPVIDENDPPTASIDLGVPRTEIENAEMKLPEGWNAELPEAIHEKSTFATFDLTYKFDKGTVYTERKLVISQRKVAAGDWKSYKKWCDSINLGYEKFIQLRRGPVSKSTASTILITPNNKAAKSNLPPTSGATGGNVTNSDNSGNTGVEESIASDSAETLIAKAMTALQKNDDQESERLLKAAEAKDAKARKLWAAYSMLATMRGMPHEAAEDARKEVERYPDETQLYGLIAGSQLQENDASGAMKTLHQWISIDSEDPRPQEILSELLLKDKRYSEAADAASKALKLLDSTDENAPRLKMTLGTAQLRIGKEKEGEEGLTALLADTQDPLTINNIVYELADAKLQLPLDEEKQKSVLSRLGAETKSWTLNEIPQILSQKSSLLVSAWDTMGWIFYREGKLSEAKAYIEAAWWNNPKAELTNHLSEVNAALGSKDASPHSADQHARTFPLGNAEGRNGVAEYRLLLSGGQVERALPAGDKSIPNGEILLKKASLAKYFPAGSDAKLMRMGMLNCHAGKCELVIEQ